MSHTYYHPYREQTFANALLYCCCYWCNYCFGYLLAAPATQLRKTRSHHQRQQFLLPLMICSIHERLSLQFRTLILKTLDVGFMSEAILSFLMCLANLLPSTAHSPLAVPHVQLPRRMTAQRAPSESHVCHVASFLNQAIPNIPSTFGENSSTSFWTMH